MIILCNSIIFSSVVYCSFVCNITAIDCVSNTAIFLLYCHTNANRISVAGILFCHYPIVSFRAYNNTFKFPEGVDLD
jgi:hypothetical protein